MREFCGFHDISPYIHSIFCGLLISKPLHTLWHEDNGGRNQFGKERPRVSGAISGPVLGEAAYRLVHNTLNIKPERMNYRNTQGNHVTNRLRPAGPPGYERGVSESQNSLSHQAPYRERAVGQSGMIEEPGRYGYQEQDIMMTRILQMDITTSLHQRVMLDMVSPRMKCKATGKVSMCKTDMHMRNSIVT
ncbi:5'-3' exoribonuclease 4 [Sesamum alatum]|uniref:5'-3' exoribonuclease 4 n=1 Tax=Sesamum alatum TaxID=300844 RepID=A0AAE1Y7B9_9LAMI|nr:5'-3' exoribonuclease 4 [Sesamum alatum]